ncbi:hypothetical protein GCM10010401_11690 [Rarobacter faecitabidus]|uniref:Uncharacterized protein DUF4381 n=1 Tax=Rarobacter faecitabidus TaxID=13243 RepID=A0A542ZP10_RARFA|nr:DUF4381 family protein [Rarobacter faecitabidus]TQL62093.1 uncharacterized protein DUF4381 [Rarobacter faecitabidus]
MADEILGPFPYSWWVIAAGLTLIVVVIGGWVWLFRATRAPRRDRGTTEASSSPAPTGTDPWARARKDALASIARIQDEHLAGGLSQREVHQELAAVLRAFTHARTGVRAESMTLSDLRAHSAATPAAELIAQLYAPEFATRAPLSADEGIERSREVVAKW